MTGEPKRTGNSDPERARDLFSRARLVWRLMGDKRVPALLKTLPVFCLIYLLSPIDLAPMLALGPLAPLGALDDIGVILLGLTAFVSLAPGQVVAEHERKLAGGSTSGGWRVADEPPSPGSAQTGDETPPMVEGFYKIVEDDK